MIKATELRIRNIVYETSIIENPSVNDFHVFEIAVINNIDGIVRDKDDNISQFDYLYGIPLTPEILERRGFEYNEIVGGYCDKNHIIYEWVNNEWGFCMFCSNDKHSTIPIKYLHQLQNLYFSLTYEELEIKELQHA